MQKNIRFSALLLVLVLLLCLLPACKQNSQDAENAFPSLIIKTDNVVEATVTLDAETVAQHKGTLAFLYELKPGDTVRDLADRDPLDNCKIREEMHFEFSLIEGNHNRIYSSFAVVFNDGSILNTGGFRMIDNPQALATSTAPLLWQSTPKGIALGDADIAAEAGAMHGMLSVNLSQLADGADSFTHNEITYAYSTEALDALTAQIQHAAAAGLSVSLTVTADVALPTAYAAALLNRVMSHTAEHQALISNLLIEQTDAVSPAQLATLCRLAHVALTSHLAEGQIFLLSNTTTLTEATAFFSEMAVLLSSNGPFPWGAAIKPTQTAAPWEDSTDDALNVSTFSTLKASLQSLGEGSIPSHFAVSDLCFSAENQELQAASFAYAYRILATSGADLIFYQKQVDDAIGLYAQDGTPRRIADVFADIDATLSPTDNAMCSTMIGSTWSDQSLSAPRRVITGLNSVEHSLAEYPLFDFANADINGFTAVGTAAAPLCNPNSSLGEPTLTVEIQPASTHTESGIRKLITDASSLRDVTAIHLRAISTATSQSTLTLTLEGTDKNNQRISYQSRAQISGEEGANIAFYVLDFTNEADLSKPVILSITQSPNAGNGEPFSLEIASIHASKLAEDSSFLLPLILIPTCVLLSAITFLLVHRRTVTRRRRAAVRAYYANQQ